MIDLKNKLLFSLITQYKKYYEHTIKKQHVNKILSL